MKIAFIHENKKIGTGANQINDLISRALKKRKVLVKHFYPRTSLIDGPRHLKGINNILFFYSLIDKRDEIFECDIVQGTTYTPLAFLAFDIPVVSHFGSTTKGFVDSVPLTKNLLIKEKNIWHMLKSKGVVDELNIKTRKPLRDIAEMESFVASNSDAVIATSSYVNKELVQQGVSSEKIHFIPNAIEDYWFGNKHNFSNPKLVYVGRMGSDVFTLKLKGVDRMIHLYEYFKNIKKITFTISSNSELISFLEKEIPNHVVCSNISKLELPIHLNELSGSIALQFSRYEGFGLGLVESMSCALVPVSFRVGIAPQIIKHGVNGFLVDNVQQMKRYVELLLSDDALRKDMAIAARDSVQQFTADQMARELIQVYKGLL